MTSIDAGEPSKPTGATLQTAIGANLAGRGIPVVLQLIAIPFYLQALGKEAYGLVGVFATVLAVCAVLDMGLGATLTRELARITGDAGAAAKARNLVRSLEIPYWSAAVLLAVVSLVAAGPVAAAWLKPEALPMDVVRRAAVLIGLAVAAQLPFTLYSGGLLGLQRQVLLNSVIIAASVVRVGGTVLVLMFVSPTIEAFFVCQLAAGALQAVAGAVALWTALPKSPEPARFDRALFAANSRFALGVAGITVVSLALTQADKIVLSKLLPLSEFAYYGIAAQIAGSLGSIVQPVFTAVFPRFSQVVAMHDDAAEAREYHRASQLMSVLLFPAAAVLAWCSRDILLGWTGKLDVADNAYAAATLLVVGSCLNGVMHVPYALMLAHGWTRLALTTNVIAVAVFVPALVVLCLHFGMMGAASAWCVLNVGYVIVSIPLMHARLVRGEKARWYLNDLARPLVGALAGAAIANALLPSADGRMLTLARVGVIAGVSLVGATSLAPLVLRPLLAKFRRSAA